MAGPLTPLVNPPPKKTSRTFYHYFISSTSTVTGHASKADGPDEQMHLTAHRHRSSLYDRISAETDRFGQYWCHGCRKMHPVKTGPVPVSDGQLHDQRVGTCTRTGTTATGFTVILI